MLHPSVNLHSFIQPFFRTYKYFPNKSGAEVSKKKNVQEWRNGPIRSSCGFSTLCVNISSGSPLISFHLILPHCISSQFMSPHLISSHLHFISFHVISVHLISSHLISSHVISSHLMSSHLISSHLISIHVTSSHLHLTFISFSSHFHVLSSHVI